MGIFVLMVQECVFWHKQTQNKNTTHSYKMESIKQTFKKMFVCFSFLKQVGGTALSYYSIYRIITIDIV